MKKDAIERFLREAERLAQINDYLLKYITKEETLAHFAETQPQLLLKICKLLYKAQALEAETTKSLWPYFEQNHGDQEQYAS